jgi:hypothetical protein
MNLSKFQIEHVWNDKILIFAEIFILDVGEKPKTEHSFSFKMGTNYGDF